MEEGNTIYRLSKIASEFFDVDFGEMSRDIDIILDIILRRDGEEESYSAIIMEVSRFLEKIELEFEIPTCCLDCDIRSMLDPQIKGDRPTIENIGRLIDSQKNKK